MTSFSWAVRLLMYLWDSGRMRRVVDVPTGTVDVWVGLLMYLWDSGHMRRVVDVPTGQWMYG